MFRALSGVFHDRLNILSTKREDYACYGTPEYWRCDPSGGEFHDAALAGNRVVDGRYEPLVVEK